MDHAAQRHGLPAQPEMLQCSHCNRRFARWQGDCLVIISDHGGKPHTNVLSRAQLRALLAETEGGRTKEAS